MTTTWAWRKSSRSVGNGQCVEVGTSLDTPMIAIRDSKLGDTSPVLTFNAAQMASFLNRAKGREFDHLA